MDWQKNRLVVAAALFAALLGGTVFLLKKRDADTDTAPAADDTADTAADLTAFRDAWCVAAIAVDPDTATVPPAELASLRDAFYRIGRGERGAAARKLARLAATASERGPVSRAVVATASDPLAALAAIDTAAALFPAWLEASDTAPAVDPAVPLASALAAIDAARAALLAAVDAAVADRAATIAVDPEHVAATAARLASIALPRRGGGAPGEPRTRSAVSAFAEHTAGQTYAATYGPRGGTRADYRCAVVLAPTPERPDALAWIVTRADGTAVGTAASASAAARLVTGGPVNGLKFWGKPTNAADVVDAAS